MKKIKFLALILLITFGLTIILLLRFNLQVFPLIYWWTVAFFVFIIWQFRLRSKFFLWVGFTIFILSALLVTVGLKNVGEISMRISFLGWIIGLIQSLGEYRSKSR